MIFSKGTFTEQVRYLRPILDCLCQGWEVGIAEGEEACWDKSVHIVQVRHGIKDACVCVCTNRSLDSINKA